MSKLSTKIGLLTLTMISMIGCKKITESNSQTKVTNGILSKNTEFRAIQLLITDQGNCSGTFLNDSKFLTAAHCIVGAKEIKVGEPRLGSPLFGNKIIAEAESWVVHPRFKSNQDSQYDLAIVSFPKGTSPLGGLKIKKEGAALAENVLIVGFGNSVIERDAPNQETTQYGNGFKRYGSNKIESKEGGLLRFLGVLSEKEAEKKGLKTGQRVLSAEGDSGGPMLNAKSEIVGVSSAAEPYFASGKILNYWSLYVDLSTTSSREFLEQNGF